MSNEQKELADALMYVRELGELKIVIDIAKMSCPVSEEAKDMLAKMGFSLVDSSKSYDYSNEVRKGVGLK